MAVIVVLIATDLIAKTLSLPVLLSQIKQYAQDLFQSIQRFPSWLKNVNIWPLKYAGSVPYSVPVSIEAICAVLLGPLFSSSSLIEGEIEL